MWYTCMMKFLFSQKRNEVQTHTTTQINPEHILSKRRQTHKSTNYTGPFILNIKNWKIYRD